MSQNIRDGEGSGGRGRRRGRGRGRGRGQGVQGDVPEDALHQIRLERQLTQRRIVALPAAARKELMSRKREAQLERMLLPDAPPRKRQTKKKSPERQPCIMVNPEPYQEDLASSTSGLSRSVESYQEDPRPSTSGLSRSVESYQEDPRPSTSGLYRSVEPYQEDPTPSTSGLSRSVEPYHEEPAPSEPSPGVSGAVMGWGDEPDIGAEVVILPSDTSPAISVTNKRYESVMEEWLQLADDIIGDSDDDDDFNIEDINERSVLEHSATAEPACPTDLTAFQAEVLQAEDDANDRVLRDIAPEDAYTFHWSKDRSTFLGRRSVFTGTPGPTFEISRNMTHVDIFDKMFDIDFIDNLCRETNRYAEQKIALLREQNKLSAHSRFRHWSPTNRDEMISFMAIIILQGLFPLTEEEPYFKFNGFGTMPYFAKIMSYNRYLLLKIMLHFVDSERLQDKTRLCKIRPVIDYFNTKFSSLYMPSREIAIDESLLKWHGRLSFAQKISSKAAQVGVKTYELCESSTGYLWKFFVYAGKDKPTDRQTDDDAANDRPTDRQTDDDATNDRPTDRQTDDDATNDRPTDRQTDDDAINDRPTDRQTDDDAINNRPTDRQTDDNRPTNATAIIVYDLIEPLLHRGHTLIMDNFYNSPLLLRCLKRQNTDCFGTLRLNREFVPEAVRTLSKSELRQGEVVATYCPDLSVLVWRDANIVSLISTYHNLEIGTRDKYNRLTYKPSIVLDYNKTMGGVDRKDQFLSAHPMERLRNRVWYKKLFRRLYNAALFNCYVIFSSVHQKISHRKFRITLAEELLKRHRQIDLTTESRLLNVRSNTTGQNVTTVMRRNTRHKTQARPHLEHNHFPIRTGSKNTCCWMCPKKTRTIWKCEECNVNLCIEGCFKAYHKP